MRGWLVRSIVTLAVVALAIGCGSRDGAEETGESSGGTTAGATTGGGTTDSGTTGGSTTEGGTTEGGTTEGGTTGEATEITISEIQEHPKSLACDDGSIENIQNNLVIRGAVVVAGKFTAKKAADDGSDPGLDGFYIAQGSGANQGIQLVTDSASVDLSVGEVVDVWGEYMEFYCHSQFRATKVESTGTSDAPAAATVTAAQLTDPAVAETFEGSLVRLESVEVLAVDQYEYTVTGGISVGGKFKPGYFANVGDSFDAIVGILDYSFSSYKIQPRTATDLEGLTEAPAKEMTISAIQQDASSTDCSSDGPQTTQQKLMTTGTVVSPVADISKNYNGVYVSDGDGAAWNGIFVLFEKTIEVTLAVGDTVNLSGDITEYYCLTEFMASAIEVTGSTTTPAPLVTTTADVLLDSEQWEGTYLTVEGLTVTNVDNATLPGSAGCDADGATCYGEFVVNDDFIIAMHDFGLDYTPEVGTSIASITGALKYSFGAYKLSPFSNADIVE